MPSTVRGGGGGGGTDRVVDYTVELSRVYCHHVFISIRLETVTCLEMANEWQAEAAGPLAASLRPYTRFQAMRLLDPGGPYKESCCCCYRCLLSISRGWCIPFGRKKEKEKLDRCPLHLERESTNTDGATVEGFRTAPLHSKEELQEGIRDGSLDWVRGSFHSFRQLRTRELMETGSDTTLWATTKQHDREGRNSSSQPGSIEERRFHRIWERPTL